MYKSSVSYISKCLCTTILYNKDPSVGLSRHLAATGSSLDHKSELSKSFWQILSSELFSSCVFPLKSTYTMVSGCMKSRTI